MRTKRLWAAVLAAALMASLTVLPAGAVQSSFRDITDETTAVNADILRLMGIVSGVGDNRFEPDGTLTRAQFCTMVVNFLQKDSEASRYATRTIFSDVGSSHWARSYINFAASYLVGSGEGDGAAAGTPLVAGVGDGKFMPDSQITLAEAVTILLRALDYTSQQAGSVWPQGYLDLARSIGLSDGLSAGASNPITRAQAAQLFMNALKCKKAGGEVYYKALGSKSEKAIIVEVNATTDDGSAQGALRTVIGADVQAYLPAHGDGNPVSLLNRRGELVLNDQDEVVTFLPDNSSRVTLVLSADAKLSGFQDGSTQYNVAKTTPVYVADGERDSGYKDSENYEKAYEEMEAGTQVTMYTENGKVVTIFAAIPGTAISTDAVVVMGRVNAATFHQLTGGRTDFTIRRGRETIQLSDLEDYDVVTYDKVSNTLLVSDLRLPCVYSGASPSIKNPESVMVLDNKFEVLESAWDTVNQFKPGEKVVLLLTADGKVAGMVSSDSKLRSTAVGEVSGGSVTVFLPNGKDLELKGTLSGTTTDGTLVTVSGTQDTLSASRLVQRRPSGDYRVSAARLDKYVVASDVRIYEQTSGGVMTPVDIKELPAGSIAANRVASYRLTSSGIVDIIVLEDVTGNAYQYGMMVSKTEIISDSYEDEEGNLVPAKTRIVWELHRRDGSEIKFANTVSYSGKSGDLVGVITGKPRNGVEGVTLTSVVQLTQVKNVKISDFFESGERQYVTVSGRTYQVSSDVECFYSRGGSRPSDMEWVKSGTGAERLAFIKGYSDDLTLYVDPVGQQVRIIRAN